MIPGYEDMTLAERREAIWGLRNGSALHMNRVRREMFESVKALITEKELPASVTSPPAKITRLKVGQG